MAMSLGHGASRIPLLGMPNDRRMEGFRLSTSRRAAPLCCPMHANRDAALKRLSRLEGQVRGIARMVEEDRYCVDVLTQIAAVRAALKGVEKLVIDDHAAHCIEDAVASGDPQEQRAKFTELLDLLDKARG